ncbi:prephenate dehydrogenase [Brachyspira hyodysenteriae]|uniref:prephenate dehydrogenase n=1 Tax=Brachyspira hyodysenteriae TaxID=159 RepID=UPI00063D9BDB|nr:prephenate dehydrogenase [Brachyspira hyodysenteriae]KLI20277.1 prephenate dehydrogenase [Brachyspira hyodysenteriae]MDA0034018.1 prephenate dehydrogenase [Brachyspira hyodysenteriae]MDA0048090.1 prephenate dehydrogenase [Brachyspira hyodysenteriae]MDA0062118.1 prephenate dehydrogenase [Brachyspira hyodysenteriae]MDA0065880.1 prephenate dehydrogenase [Brachyspira hyodysenteriae]
MSNITVIGMGLMGGSLIKALKLSNQDYHIYAIDTNKENIESALKDGYIEKGSYNYDNIKELIELSDIIMICTIPSIAIDIINKYKHLINNNQILSDFCGVKTDIFNNTKDKKYVGLHTMAGKEKGGYINSSETLFKNSNAIILNNENANENDINIIEKLSKDIGCLKIKKTTAQKHDEMIAFTSQLMHIVACGIVNHDHFLPSLGFEGNSLGDHTRVGTIDANMWSELFLYNSDYLYDSLDKYIKCLDDFKNALKNKDRNELKRLMQHSNNTKKEWLDLKNNDL